MKIAFGKRFAALDSFFLWCFVSSRRRRYAPFIALLLRQQLLSLRTECPISFSSVAAVVNGKWRVKKDSRVSRIKCNKCVSKAIGIDRSADTWNTIWDQDTQTTHSIYNKNDNDDRKKKLLLTLFIYRFDCKWENFVRIKLWNQLGFVCCTFFPAVRFSLHFFALSEAFDEFIKVLCAIIFIRWSPAFHTHKIFF